MNSKLEIAINEAYLKEIRNLHSIEGAFKIGFLQGAQYGAERMTEGMQTIAEKEKEAMIDRAIKNMPRDILKKVALQDLERLDDQ